MWHTATALSLGPGQTQVTMFGGCPKWERGKSVDALQKLAKTTVLDFGEQNTYNSIHSLAVSGLFISLIDQLPALLVTLEFERVFGSSSAVVNLIANVYLRIIPRHHIFCARLVASLKYRVWTCSPENLSLIMKFNCEALAV